MKFLLTSIEKMSTKLEFVMLEIYYKWKLDKSKCKIWWANINHDIWNFGI